jgi:hypothetical protein
MAINKINNLIEKYKLSNILKVIALLLVLFLVYRIFINSIDINININTDINTDTNKIIEGFETLNNGNLYGNIITLQNSQNTPYYSGNTCTLSFDDIYRIDTLIFKFNTGTNSYTSDKNIYIQYKDSDGNMRNLKSSNSPANESPPNFKSLINNITLLSLPSITDENGLAVYTSSIILTIGDTTNKIDNFNDSNKNGYIKEFGAFGGSRDLPSLSDYNNLSNSLILHTLQTPREKYDNNINTYTFTQGDNSMIYSFRLNISFDPPGLPITPINSTESPFIISIVYNNTLYPQNDFTINTKYKIRYDMNMLKDPLYSSYTYIFLTEPIIANKIIFSSNKLAISGNSNSFVNLKITGAKILDKSPTATDISDYKRTVNLLTTSESISGSDTGICPSINDLVDTQTKTQQICDNLEFQDKAKSEKLRLERNKQYLLKLKDQQEQVDQLNMVIQDLETKRQARATISDQARLLQYQKQKGDASTVRDLANQRLESQANNQLYMDVNITN